MKGKQETWTDAWLIKISRIRSLQAEKKMVRSAPDNLLLATSRSGFDMSQCSGWTGSQMKYWCVLPDLDSIKEYVAGR